MTNDAPSPPEAPSPLDRARGKAYRRLLPLLFLCYVIAYIDRSNVAIAFRTMKLDLPGFNNDVLGTGFGIFFIGYFLLEIPGSLIVEKWSARKWISRIMISWGVVAALTALVTRPWQFYGARFILGLAEAGFFPGVIVYLTHWFPSRDRTRALAWFLIEQRPWQTGDQPADLVPSDPQDRHRHRWSTGRSYHDPPEVMGLEGWQWVYITWGIPAVLLGLLVLGLPHRPPARRAAARTRRAGGKAELARRR